MPAPILYFGDTSLTTAAAYLGGLLAKAGWIFDYVASDVSVDAPEIVDGRSLVILSDYPSARMSPSVAEAVVEAVSRGTGLVMLGGWESYHGLGGDWDRTAVARILPVEISAADDRRNCDHPVFLQPVSDHPILRGLPWKDRPPLIGGFNQVRPKPGTEVLLEGVHVRARFTPVGLEATPTDRTPLLAVSHHGSGRVACLMTDVAPHWVGPLVDWGDARITAQAPGAGEVEVGSLYALFFTQLLEWAMKR